MDNSSFTDEDDDEAAMDYAMANKLGVGVCDWGVKTLQFLFIFLLLVCLLLPSFILIIIF